ncbi:MAG: CapA family protein [Pseudomonadota bacterium]
MSLDREGATKQPLSPLNQVRKKNEPPPREVDWRSIRQVTVMAVGDIMTHDLNIELAFDKSTGEYDFFPYFELTAPIFAQADWVLGNLETRLAGEGARYTGYPLFNAPDQLAFALKKAGFSLVSTANNHCLDRGAAGIATTNETLSRAGLLHTGSFSDPEDRNSIRMLRKNGLCLAVVAYTYGTNSRLAPRGRSYMVNVIDPDAMAADFRRARDEGADFTACLIHFGQEYQLFPNQAQKKLTDFLFSLGADLVLGSHPHVVQPYRFSVFKDQGRVAVYSLGNFISNQQRKFTDLSVIFQATLLKDSQGIKRVAGIKAVPIKVLRLVLEGRPTFRVFPMNAPFEFDAGWVPSCREIEDISAEFSSMKKHFRAYSS